MTKSGFARRVLLYEVLGFALVIAVIWADELLDLPYYFLGARSSMRWPEAALESGLVFLLGVLTVFQTQRVLARLRYLEGFLQVCSFCKRIRMGEKWIPIIDYVTYHTEAVFSHGLCPECLKREYPEYAGQT